MASGSLHLRAPQTKDASGNLTVKINPIDGRLINPSSIVAEGYKAYTPTGGTISLAVQTTVASDARAFAANTATLSAALTANWGKANGSGVVLNSGLTTTPDVLLHIQPGVEIDGTKTKSNALGSLTLATTWDLSSVRFGPNATTTTAGSGEPGVLTLRATGNINFPTTVSLTDGFDTSKALLSTSATSKVWTAPLMAGQSWSYRLVSGADLSSANFRGVAAMDSLSAANTGSVLVGAGTALTDQQPCYATGISELEKPSD